uniref:E2F transcription factor 6 n=1 Tax=Amphilophus citrinellus TaxID=61819 RepID=A0A3Q0QWM1_AMPCI
MVKCVVSGCPNRASNCSRGDLPRPPKRFFSFPEDPMRVQVWLAALRETDREDNGEQLLICEDHFLPEDISKNGIARDAIPLMPPYLGGPLGPVSAWGVDSSEDDEQWATGGCSDDEEDEFGESVPSALNHLQQVGVCSNVTNSSRVALYSGVSLGQLTRGFLELLLAAPDGSLDLRQAAANLRTSVQRVDDITGILDDISLIQRESTHKIKWISPSSFLWRNQQKFHSEIQKLKLVEDVLDSLIRRCAQQLFNLTDDVENTSYPSDIRRLRAFQDQTAIIIKAPEETKMEIPAPTEQSIEVHLKAVKGPIMVMTCEVGSGDAVTSNQRSSLFLTLKESRIRTTALVPDVSLRT